MRLQRYLFGLTFFLLCTGLTAQNLVGTYPYAEKDGAKLYLNIYQPYDKVGVQRGTKPTIIFMFGGSFMTGKRDAEQYLPWFKKLNEEGYAVVSIDYRLGMKGKEYRFSPFEIIETADNVQRAVEMAVADLFSATQYLLTHGKAHGIDPYNMVVSGSSAGALAALSAEWEICNATDLAKMLPEGFNYVGVISFAGALMTNKGTPQYLREPCPQLLFHGVEDKIVAYSNFQAGKRGIWGSSALARLFAATGYNFQIYRYVGNGHEIANLMLQLWDEQASFLKQNVEGGKWRVIDAVVADPSLAPQVHP